MSEQVRYMVDYEYFSSFTSQWFPARAEMYGDRLPTKADRKVIEKALSKHKGASVFIKSVQDMQGNVLFVTGSWSAV
jgi:hypothetical protein